MAYLAQWPSVEPHVNYNYNGNGGTGGFICEKPPFYFTTKGKFYDSNYDHERVPKAKILDINPFQNKHIGNITCRTYNSKPLYSTFTVIIP